MALDLNYSSILIVLNSACFKCWPSDKKFSFRAMVMSSNPVQTFYLLLHHCLYAPSNQFNQSSLVQKNCMKLWFQQVLCQYQKYFVEHVFKERWFSDENALHTVRDYIQYSVIGMQGQGSSFWKILKSSKLDWKSKNHLSNQLVNEAQHPF